MPLVQIHLAKGKSDKKIQMIADGIHESLVRAWKIPQTDRFQMIMEYKKSHFHFDPKIWGVKRKNVVAIYITSVKRSQIMKKKLYQEFVKILAKKANIRKEDIFVTIVTVQKEDWSFGNGIAQLLDPKEKP